MCNFSKSKSTLSSEWSNYAMAVAMLGIVSSTIVGGCAGLRIGYLLRDADIQTFNRHPETVCKPLLELPKP
jgi:hypothetical protein